MTKTRILAVQTHYGKDTTNAADWWRVIRPAEALQARGHDVEIRRGIVSEAAAKAGFKDTAESDWRAIGERFDVVYYSYNHSPGLFSWLMTVAKKYGLRVVIDYDDNVLQQDLLNPTSVMQLSEDPREQHNIEVVLQHVPEITVTSEYLAGVYSSFLKLKGIEKPIHVIPNAIDLSVYQAPKKKRRDEVVIGFFGSTSHQADLYEKEFFKAIQKLRRNHPNVRFEVLGNFVPGYLNAPAPDRVIEGSSDFYSWVKLWKEHVAQWDIAVAPLRDTPFNKGRSSIKWQETAAASIPLVASDRGVYPQENVLLCRNRNEWYERLAGLVTMPSYRTVVGSKAYRELTDGYTIEATVARWEEVLCHS